MFIGKIKINFFFYPTESHQSNFQSQSHPNPIPIPIPNPTINGIGIQILCSSWSAPAFEGMNKNDSRPHLIDEDGDNYIKSWIGSSLTGGAMF